MIVICPLGGLFQLSRCPKTQKFSLFIDLCSKSLIYLSSTQLRLSWNLANFFIAFAYNRVIHLRAELKCLKSNPSPIIDCSYMLKWLNWNMLMLLVRVYAAHARKSNQISDKPWPFSWVHVSRFISFLLLLFIQAYFDISMDRPKSIYLQQIYCG